jgi:hypothetical protein
MGESGNPLMPIMLFQTKANIAQYRTAGQQPQFDNIADAVEAISATFVEDPAVINILTAIASIDRGLAIRACPKLGKIAQRCPEYRKDCVTALLKVLPVCPNKPSALKALGDIGPDAKEALPEIRKLKTDPDEAIRKAAGKAVEAIEK